MDTVSVGKELLLAGAEEYAPQDRGPGVVYLDKLRLFLRLRQVQALDRGFLAVFISEVTTSTHQGQAGLCVTCVGIGTDMRSAVVEAVGHWTLGVLPVLAHWRGQHSCLSNNRELQTRGGSFTLLGGPTILRGCTEGQPPPGFSEALWPLLDPVLRARPLAARVHWLELFVSKSTDGEVEPTCRLNNRDWAEGAKLLQRVAAAWPPSPEPLQSCRQFALLVPQTGDAEAITLPSFWERLRSRA